ncbi:MAG: c-type cytochrome [Hyphomicrobiaceae bacterium]
MTGRRAGGRDRIRMALAACCLALPADSVSAGDVAFGEYLSGECVTCHRKDGADKGIPPIVGWPEDQFVAVLQSYKDKDRDNPVMQNIAGKLNKEEIEALAAYFATLKPAN